MGTIALVDFNLLGFGMRRQTAAQLDKTFGSWTMAGLAIMIFSGLLLFSSDPDMYYLNLSFDMKMVCLVLAILFNYTIHRKVVYGGSSPGMRKLVACISLVLWAAVIFGGIFIGFVNEGLSLKTV